MDNPREADGSSVCLVGANGSCVHVGLPYRMRLVAPFGFSSRQDVANDLAARIRSYVSAGADIVQELSTIGPYAQLRKDLVQAAGVPYGTVLTYEVFDRMSGKHTLRPRDIRELVLETVHDQVTAGVAYMTIHAGLSSNLLDATAADRARRAIPESSRAGGMIQTLMHRYNVENPLYEYFREIVDLCADSKVVISLGSALRPAAIADAMDAVQIAEINAQGRMVEMAQSTGVGVMLEGLSHGIATDLQRYVNAVIERCGPVPVTALGPLPTDIAAGMDHVAAAIGVIFGSEAGLSLVNIVTSVEHLAMPSEEDVVDAIRASRVALHIIETSRVGRLHPRDRAMSQARAHLSWSEQTNYSLFPDLVSSLIDKESLEDGKGCTICGRRCPLVRREATQLC